MGDWRGFFGDSEKVMRVSYYKYGCDPGVAAVVSPRGV